MEPNAKQVSSLLDDLPGVFQADRERGQPNFLGRFLLAFEKLLLGLGDANQPGIEEVVAKIYRYFEPGGQITKLGKQQIPEPERAPADFLPWLSGWLALSLREDWDDQRRRNLIANASELYRLRGTKRGVAEFVQIYTLLGVTIDEIDTAFQIGVHSTIGKDTYLGGGAPFFFRVRVVSPTTDPQHLKTTTEVAQAIVELQKPAHTYFTLTVDSPVFQIGEHSTVGVDTLLG
jgi:phage tail-like protein